MNFPKVGVGVLIFKDGKILLGKRKNAHGGGEYAPPGGGLEHLENFFEGARREVKEETGMEIENPEFICVFNMKHYAPEHYISVGIKVDWKSGEPENLEPAKCEGWNWYGLDNLPEPLFANIPIYLKALKDNQHFIDGI